MRIFYVFICCIGIVLAQPVIIDTRDGREVKMAEHAIFMALVIANNPASRYLCAQNDYACLGVNQGELGLTILGNKDKNNAYAALVNLVRFRLDGSLGEDFTCHMVGKGKKIIPYLSKGNPKKLFNKCVEDVTEVVRANKGKIDSHIGLSVCESEDAIRKKIQRLLGAIKSGKKCLDSDF